MPKYIPNYTYEIFVSYAHVDNKPFVGVDKGWVTSLIDELKNHLEQKLGAADACSLWIDSQLRGNEAVTPYIDKQLTNSAIFVLFLSRGYMNSVWCRSELNTFFSQVGGGSGRIFMIIQDNVITRKERPPELQDLIGYEFYQDNDTGRSHTLGKPQPNPETEPEYYDKVDQLAEDLAEKLNELKEEALAVEQSNNDKLSRINDKSSRINFLNLKWFLLTLVFGFFIYIPLVWIRDNDTFLVTIADIILNGNLLFFLMAVTASIFIDNIMFTSLKEDIFKVSGIFPMVIIGLCAIFLAKGKQYGDVEFIFMVNLELFFCALIYAVTHHLSYDVSNCR